MVSVLPFVPNKCDFHDAVTRVMGEAFDAACRELHDAGMPAVVHEVLARRIIDAAREGERDPTRLRDVALAALARTKRV
jgi:hypothetical protein